MASSETETLTRAGRLVPVGTAAPDFTLPSTVGGEVTLSALRGKPVILAFYPADWSPVCSDQLSLYQAVLPEFEQFGATLLGISVDSIWSHLAFAKSRGITFPLLSDFEPKGRVSREYGVYDEAGGTSERALFVLDPEGVVFWNHLSPRTVSPGADGILKALERMSEKQP
jgi:peroxiredoxin